MNFLEICIHSALVSGRLELTISSVTLLGFELNIYSWRPSSFMEEATTVLAPSLLPVFSVSKSITIYSRSSALFSPSSSKMARFIYFSAVSVPFEANAVPVAGGSPSEPRRTLLRKLFIVLLYSPTYVPTSAKSKPSKLSPLSLVAYLWVYIYGVSKSTGTSKRLLTLSAGSRIYWVLIGIFYDTRGSCIFF